MEIPRLARRQIYIETTTRVYPGNHFPAWPLTVGEDFQKVTWKETFYLYLKNTSQ